MSECILDEYSECCWSSSYKIKLGLVLARFREVLVLARFREVVGRVFPVKQAQNGVFGFVKDL